MVGSCLRTLPWCRRPGFKRTNAGTARMAPQTARAHPRSRPGALGRNLNGGLSSIRSIETDCSYAINVRESSLMGKGLPIWLRARSGAASRPSK
jgi:hypothetical protein